MWSCAGVAARAEGAWPMGHALELWVCSLKGVPLVLPTSYAKGDERDGIDWAIDTTTNVERLLDEC